MAELAVLITDEQAGLTVQRRRRAETTRDNRKGRCAMGDKGKKDKEKGQKQNTEKQQKEAKKKLEKQPGKKP